MNWLERNGNWESPPYKVVWAVRGWDAWVLGQFEQRCLGREFLTAAMGKQKCLEHSQREKAA